MSLFTFNISAGLLTGPGISWAAFSGHNTALVLGYNNPAACNCKGVGPLPPGLYTCGPLEPTHAVLGPFVMALLPADNHPTFGRGSFYIHGAAAVHPELSSDGCIILPRTQRLAMDTLMTQNGNRILLVAP